MGLKRQPVCIKRSRVSSADNELIAVLTSVYFVSVQPLPLYQSRLINKTTDFFLNFSLDVKRFTDYEEQIRLADCLVSFSN